MSPKQVKIVEVGPRDGLQNEKKLLNVETRTELVARLIRAGAMHIETGAFVSPKWVPQMAQSAEVHKLVQQSASKKIVLMSLVPNARGFEDAKAAGVKDIAVFTAASETFSKKNTNATIQESMDRIREVMVLAKKNKIRVRGYISTCFYCPFEGKISEKVVVQLTKDLIKLGAYEVSIGDTIGAAVPTEVESLIKKLKKVTSAKKLAMHFHDTRGTALANILQALKLGIRTFDSSLGGLGGCPYAPGAAGNVATEDVVYMLEGMGFKTGFDLKALNQTTTWIEPLLGRKLRGAVPFSK